MCIAVPSKIISMDNQMAVVEVDGVRRETSLMLVPEAVVGDYVIVHAGFAIQVLDEMAARETLALIREAAAFLGPDSGNHNS
jgi:hydrogenase expression/formation protein HypC